MPDPDDAHAAPRAQDAAAAPLMVSVSGLRAVVGASLSTELITRYAAAVAAWLREEGAEEADPVILARDGRAGGRIWSNAAASTLAAAGFRVIDLGAASTPTAGVMVKHHAAAGGLVVTASHNPQQWNGLKPLDRKGQAPHPASASRIREHFSSHTPALAPWDALGRLDADDTAAHVHVARVLAALQSVADPSTIRDRAFRVAVDSVNASGAAGARLLLEALACRLTHLHNDASGLFPHPPEPIECNLTDLARITSESNVDVAFAQDPDADRLAIIDEKGRFIGEEKTLVLAAKALLSAPRAHPAPARISVNLSTSRMIEDLAADQNAEVIRTPVGEANVVASMTLEPGRLVFAGEGNGGVIWPEVVNIRDSLSAMALVLALMAREGKPLSQLADELTDYAIVKEKTPIEGLDPRAALDRLAAAFDAAAIDRQDGVRVDLPEERAWLHARASNTEPILRFIAEAPTHNRARQLVDAAIQHVGAGR